MTPVLETQSLATTTPDGLNLSSDISFELRAGELILVTGDNGSGKTTLARALIGLHAHYRGEVRRHLRLDEIAYLPQLGNVQFFLPLTLRDVIQLKIVGAEDKTILDIGLLQPDTLDRPWNSASGGERQKTLLTRLFLGGAKLLILDEPYNHLDQRARRQVEQRLERSLASGNSVLLISHTSGELRPTRHLHLERKGGE
jgi:ABC-type Mn2+/Zn2+ transport system ATPase subunit